MDKMMKAVVLDKPTKGEEIVLSEIAVPEVIPGWVLVKVKAFGMNHSEAILRKFEIENDYIHKPIIPGIECVGEIEDLLTADGKKDKRSPLLWAAWAGALTAVMRNMHCFRFTMYSLWILPFHGKRWLQFRRLISRRGVPCFNASG